MDKNKIITSEDVQRMATLARLHLSEETQEIFARQFGDILSYMDTLATVPTDAIEPLYSPSMHESPVRQDVACSTCTRDALLQNAPSDSGEYFVVPRIV